MRGSQEAAAAAHRSWREKDSVLVMVAESRKGGRIQDVFCRMTKKIACVSLKG